MVKKLAADLKQNVNVAQKKVQQILNLAKTSPKLTPINEKVHSIPKKVLQAARPVVQKTPKPTSKGQAQKKVEQQKPQPGKTKIISSSKVHPNPSLKARNVIPGVSFGASFQIKLTVR